MARTPVRMTGTSVWRARTPDCTVRRGRQPGSRLTGHAARIARSVFFNASILAHAVSI
ncbi:MAG: hypothetical protein HZC54_20765 [Verrucomicrobia bacterium]|nr:hypothetical protein [Verrucomicrobiota bacterium]